MSNEDEQPDFWRRKPLQLLAETAAVLHRERRLATERRSADEVAATRRAIGHMMLRGNGVEVGAGDRPWPLPPGAACYYGDIRDRNRLAAYFHNTDVAFNRKLDAQTFAGITDAAFDFVISAHVLEHLQDPVGAIRATMRVLRTGGIALIALPDMRHTFDRARPPTTLDHLLADARDGGAGTRLQAYMDHVLYVHPLLTNDPPFPPAEAQRHAQQISRANMDIHYHAWTVDTFLEQLNRLANDTYTVDACVPVANEGIFVLRKT